VSAFVDYINTLKKKQGNETVQLVEDLMQAEESDGKNEVENNDKLRRIFSRKSVRCVKTPPRRMHTD
jgi:hypothetical protein